MEYYPIVILYLGKQHLCIWKTDEADEFETDGRCLLVFNSINEAKHYLEGKGLNFSSDEAVVYDLDGFLKEVNFEEPDPKTVLYFWNMFSDMARGLGLEFSGDGKKVNKIYEKLFFGNNLPTVTPEGESYTPVFSDREKKIIESIISEGVSLAKSQLEEGI